MYPPFMGDTARSQKSFSTPDLYFGARGCQRARRSCNTVSYTHLIDGNAETAFRKLSKNPS